MAEIFLLFFVGKFGHACSPINASAPMMTVCYPDENCGGALAADNSKMERVVMRCVLESAISDGEAIGAPKVCRQIERCAKLLQKCTASSQSESKLSSGSSGKWSVLSPTPSPSRSEASR